MCIDRYSKVKKNASAVFSRLHIDLQKDEKLLRCSGFLRCKNSICGALLGSGGAPETTFFRAVS